MLLEEQLDMRQVCGHYSTREDLYSTMRGAFDRGDVTGYVNLALGMTNPMGNHSAAEHKLGHRILSECSHDQVFALAKSLDVCHSPLQIPEVIRRHNLKFLKIGVGSEMALMLQPNKFWVINIRSFWAHLLVENQGNSFRADEARKLYLQRGGNSDMDYDLWSGMYPEIGRSLDEIHDWGVEETKHNGLEPGKLKYLWADTVADALYQSEHGK